METLAQPEPEEPLAPNFSKHQLTLDFVRGICSYWETKSSSSVSAWEEEVYI